MKRIILIIATLCILNTAQAQDLKSLLKGLFGSSEKKESAEKGAETPKYLTAQEIAGSWIYAGAAISYTGDDVLASMAVTALQGQIESYCAKAGIVAGRDKVILGRGGTLLVQIGEKKASGTYSYDPKTGAVTLRIAIGGKQGTLTGSTAWENGTLTLLFDAEEALSAMKAAAPELAQKEQVKMASTLIANYPGIKIGARATR